MELWLLRAMKSLYERAADLSDAWGAVEDDVEDAMDWPWQTLASSS